MTDVTLRPWKKEDAYQLTRIANNKLVWNNLRDSVPFPYTLKNAEQWIAFASAQKPLQNFAVLYNAALAGSIGCIPKADVYKKNIEIGYFIGEDFWNLGIGTKAVGILINYIQKHFYVVRMYAEVFSHNKASMKVLQKNGFYLESIRRKNALKNNVLLDDYIWVKMNDSSITTSV